MEINNEEFRKFATRTKRPIAGQSLTDDPENPWPWERPPRFTTKEEGIDFFASLFTDEEVFPTLMELIRSEVAIMDIEQEEIEYIIIDDEDELEEAPESGNVLRNNLRKIETPQNDQEIDLTEKIQGAPSLMARPEGG